MFNRILRFSIEFRFAVLIGTVLLAVVGVVSYRNLIIDAVPDITNIQAQINTEAQGYSPFEVEQRITLPIEQILAGMPALEYTRSLSRYGLSQVTAVFRDGTDIYFARQLIAQRLQESRSRLPAGITPAMGPIATGLGEIFQFIVENKEGSPSPKSLQELREIQDWVVRPQLKTVLGVVDVNSIGGASKQIVVSPDIEKLRAYGLTLNEVSRAISENNSNVGAGFIEQNGEQFLVRVPSQVDAPEQIGEIVVGVHEGTPIQVKNIAEVEIGSELRAGAATENGKEVVLGTVFMLMGENGRAVAERVSAKLEEIGRSVPEGVVVKPVYNRARLVNDAIATVRKNLIEGALLVIVILFVALGNLRAALITACVIPLSMTVTIFGMVQGKLSANLMSLGALDFGLIVDGAVILVENCVKRMREERTKIGRELTREERLELVYSSSSEVRQATMFGELIIMVVYIPILALSGIEGKMFHPMAITVLLALGAAFVFSLTFVPAAVAVFMSRAANEHSPLFDRFGRFYERALKKLIYLPKRVISAALVLLVASLAVFFQLGSEFVPSLDEGDIAMHALRIPGTSLSQSIDMQHQLERAIEVVPEVSEVFAKIGTAEIATDPMPPSVADGYVIMKPRSLWPNPAKPKIDVVADIERVARSIPGSNYEFTQPIQMRFNELIAGVRSDLAIKVFGDDMRVLFEQAEKIEKILNSIPGASDVKVEQVSGLPMITIKPDRATTARWGLNSADIQQVVRTAYSGDEVSRFYQGDRNFPIVVRLRDSDRRSGDAIKQLPIALPPDVMNHKLGVAAERATLKVESPDKPYVTLQEVAQVDVGEGPNQISRENGKRRVVVTANVRNRDLGSFVAEAERRVFAEAKLPPGYWLGWGGQYEHMIAAQSRLMIVVPLVLISVFALVYLTFRSFTYSLLVYSGIPFALCGGICALWLRGIPFSISAAVGFIALSGVSVLNGLVLVSFIRKLIDRGENRISAVVHGAVSRLRPVLMTALVASLGFVPMALSQGTGSEVQRPLATVVIGGILSSTALTLLVLPVLISLVGNKPKNGSCGSQNGASG
jgi:cobalt-zinc-cadmium resistance protein CzcA